MKKMAHYPIDMTVAHSGPILAQRRFARKRVDASILCTPAIHMVEARSLR